MNHYFALRHGESVPNTKGIILSHLDEGKKHEYTLTKNGEEQVARSVREMKESGILIASTIIYSSPLSRCVRTAEIAKEILGVHDPIIFDDRLRERWFGDWEGTSNANYDKVWSKDIFDPEHHEEGVESPGDVARRVAALIKELDEHYDGKNILLVSHGDSLQILQSWFRNVSPSTHRSLPHLAVAEVRKIN